jgi:lysophospholipase L1-like esterase
VVILRFHCIAIAICLLAVSRTAAVEVLVRSGDRVGFLGDSITENGWRNPAGYARLVVAGLKANGVEVEAVPAGVSGNKSNDLLQRLDRDVLARKPQWMLLNCGVNDVWHGVKGVPLNEIQASTTKYERNGPKESEKGTYEKNITQIAERAQAAGVKVVILTATVIGENLAGEDNQRLAPYNDFLRRFASEKQIPLADLNARFQDRIKAAGRAGENVFTVDGVHMNTEGNKVIARGVLQALGCDERQIRKAEEAWAPLERRAAARGALKGAMMWMTGHAVLVTMVAAAVGVAIGVLWTRRKRAMAGEANA